MTDPFTKLGIPAHSSAAAIKKAYRNLAKSCHPDMRNDKEAATIEFRELTRIYEIALKMVGKTPPPKPKPTKPKPPPPPKPSGIIRENVSIIVDNFDISLFGAIIRDVRVSPQILEYGGFITVTLRQRGRDNINFEFEVPPKTANAKKFRFNHTVGIIEIQLVSER